jgi:hypothetical protein
MKRINAHTTEIEAADADAYRVQVVEILRRAAEEVKVLSMATLGLEEDVEPDPEDTLLMNEEGVAITFHMGKAAFATLMGMAEDMDKPLDVLHAWGTGKINDILENMDPMERLKLALSEDEAQIIPLEGDNMDEIMESLRRLLGD